MRNVGCLIRICVVHLGRAIPVGWRVIKHNSSSVKLAAYQDLLNRVARLLPSQPKIVLLADRGFADAQLVRYVRQLGWQCRIRARRFQGKLPPKSSLIKGNFWLRHPRHGLQRVSQFPLTLGSAQLIHNVQIHKHHSLTDVHLAIGWEETSGEKWYILSTEPTTLQTFREYSLRFTIEENLRSLSGRVSRPWKRPKPKMISPLALIWKTRSCALLQPYLVCVW